jgi:hypothetical protein
MAKGGRDMNPWIFAAAAVVFKIVEKIIEGYRK